MKKQAGFTLIELIIVIVILGILAVTAAPKFLNLQGDANSSTIKGVDGALNSAMSTVYGKSVIAASHKQANADADSIEGIEINFGYPQATENALEAALDINLDASGDGDFDFEPLVGATAGIAIFPNGKLAVDCSVSYFEAADESTPAFTTVVTTGC